MGRALAYVPLAVLACVLAASPAGAQGSAVRAWEGTEAIPTYEEGPPDVNPPFDLFVGGRFNYPYTMREALTDRRAPRVWRTLNLENEHLRVSVLPDLGGRLWRCVDKANGAQMFYANPSLKFAQVAYRGAWATFGIEFNFPVSHSWVTSSPVDHALVTSEDGSAAIVVGNVDLVYGMQWRVELRLRPGRSVLEQTTILYNRGDLRHRFYWWTNAAVQSWDDSVLVYPMEFTSTHGFTRVDTWPVDSAGIDLSRPGNHRRGAVSLFSHGSHEPFMGVYHPRTRAGVVHWADPVELPAKKIWSWGVDAEGLDWRKALSDDDSAEVEIQAGLFRNQETYAFLEPQETIRFHEDWMPVRNIGGISRANPEAIVHIARETSGPSPVVTVGLQVTRAQMGGRLRVRDGERMVADEPLDLDASQVGRRSYPDSSPGARYTVEILDASGRMLLAHTEGRLDLTPAPEIVVGPQHGPRVPPRAEWSAADFVEQGQAQELEGKRLRAWDTYDEGRSRFPECAAIGKAAGRLAVDLGRFDEAVPLLRAAMARVTTDAEVQYALAAALAARGENAEAQSLWEAASHFRRTRSASLLQLGRLAARAGDPEAALARLREAIREEPDATRAGGMEVALLRRRGRRAEAARRLAYWRALDPTSSMLRHEAVLAGAPGESLWRHLAGDPQRVLEIAVDYMELGAFDDALLLLDRRYPSEGVVPEPGMPLPQAHAEAAYYRAYCRERTGASARADFASASRLPTTYVFPRRAASFPVLRRAVEVDPADATAHFLLGSLYLSGGMKEEALAEWEAARRLNARLPVLHRNLGLTLIHAGEYERARQVLAEGVSADPRNVEVYEAFDQALGLLGRPAEERARALQSYPDPAAMPPSLVFKLALALVEAARFDEAEALFRARFFPREEFGTNVREAWLEVRLQRALALARGGRGDEARRIAMTLGDAAPDLPFTRTGLPAFLESARVLYLKGEALSLAGDQAEAQRAFEAAARGADAYPNPDAAFAVLAARRLGPGREAEARARLEAALESWRNRLAVGTNYPGANAAGQGQFLRALGRDAESKAKLREALLLPDKVMSHYLSRLALAEGWGRKDEP